MCMSYLIKIGGSLLFDKNGDIEVEKIKKFADIIKSVSNVGCIVCGGGIIARKYIHAARGLGLNESYLDLLGIDVSRVNARLLIASLGDNVFPSVIKSVEEAMIASISNKTIISGGFIPGQSTTTVSMEIAEAMNINRILILTDVDGIYDKNPKEFTDAQKYDKITIDDLEKVILGSGGENQSAAGEYRIFDALSVQIFKRSNIMIRLINGNKSKDLDKILKSDFLSSKLGTLIIK